MNHNNYLNFVKNIWYAIFIVFTTLLAQTLRMHSATIPFLYIITSLINGNWINFSFALVFYSFFVNLNLDKFLHILYPVVAIITVQIVNIVKNKKQKNNENNNSTILFAKTKQNNEIYIIWKLIFVFLLGVVFEIVFANSIPSIEVMLTIFIISFSSILFLTNQNG